MNYPPLYPPGVRFSLRRLASNGGWTRTRRWRRVLSRIVRCVLAIPPPKPDPGHEGYQATQKQRYLERQIRASKRMEAAAIDPRDIDTAKQRIRAYQAKLRDHIKQHDLPRRRHREQIKMR
ncbi:MULTISPECIES: phage minor capsid protein [Corynebacterium]|uniref:phage minor capsid protein n=1 Tax=Corynebacterium TaxID=1716 RepID=UPI001E3D5C5D|nr:MULTISPECIES: phage minor capsid protein [Corynebacterium]